MSVESTEQAVAKDLMSVRNAVVENWDDIIANSGKIETLIKDGFTWVEENETTFEGNLKTAETKFTTELGKLKPSDFDTALKNISKDIGSDVNSLFTKLYKVKSELDPAKAIDVLLSDLPATPNIPGIPGLSASTFQSIFETLFGDHFSVALKKFPPRKTQPEGTPPPGNGAGNDSGVSAGLVATMFSSYETELGTKLAGYEIQLNSMKNSLETLVSSGVTKSLETNLGIAIQNLENEGSALTAKLILAQFNTLIDKEVGSALSIGASAVTNLKKDLAGLRGILDHLLNTVKADTGSEFAEIYNDIFDTSDEPTLLEAISFILAIPLTLTEHATGKSFTFPNSPFQTFDAAAKKEMTGILQILDIVIALSDKAYNHYQTQHDNPVPYQYKIFMGAISSIKTALFQVAFSPDGGFNAKVSKGNVLWGIQWGTGLTFSSIQWMLDATVTYKNQDQTDLVDFQKKIQALCDSYDTNYKILSAVPEIKGQILPDINKYFNRLKLDVKDLLINNYEFKLCISSLEELSTRRIEVNDGIKSLISKFEGIRYEGDEDTIIKNIEACNVQLVEVIEEAKRLSTYDEKRELSPKQKSNQSGSDKFLNEICPTIDIVLSLGTLGWKIYLNKEGLLKTSTLGKVILSTATTVLSDGLGLYYYKKEEKLKVKEEELTEEEKKYKNYMNNTIFAVSQITGLVKAIENLKPSN